MSFARAQSSRLLADQCLAVSRQATLRNGFVSASPSARRGSLLRAEKEETSDKTAAKVVAEEPAKVIEIEDTVTTETVEVEAKKASDTVVEVEESVPVAAKDETTATTDSVKVEGNGSSAAVAEVEESVPTPEVTEEKEEAATEEKTTTEDSVEYTYSGPEPQRFAVGEGQTGQILGAALNPTFRLFSGGFTKGYTASLDKAQDGAYSVAKAVGRQVTESSIVNTFKRPSQPLELYEFEGCPFCKKVREAVSILDLDVIYYPCPRNGPTFRPKAIELGGKRSFPYLVDPGAGKAMYESDDIIQYLFEEYGDGEVPVGLRLGVLTTLSCGLSLSGRLLKGSTYRAAKMPEKPIIFWAYEASPFCKIVKEVLCELEIPHLMKTVARGSPKRQELFEIAGHFQVPYIQDPNTGVAMFESGAIIEYLNETYAA